MDLRRRSTTIPMTRNMVWISPVLVIVALPQKDMQLLSFFASLLECFDHILSHKWATLSRWVANPSEHPVLSPMTFPGMRTCLSHWCRFSIISIIIIIRCPEVVGLGFTDSIIRWGVCLSQITSQVPIYSSMFPYAACDTLKDNTLEYANHVTISIIILYMHEIKHLHIMYTIVYTTII